MVNPAFRDMTFADAPKIVSLNEAVVDVTSPMDTECFTTLYELSDVHLVAEVNSDVIGFVLAIKNGRIYDNGNYQWFTERLESFLYIDRIVVSEACRGLGIGRLFYSAIYEVAEQLGVVNACVEMDLDPPNRKSLDFHEKAGFVQVGTRVLDSGKQVSMQTRLINRASSSET